MVERIESVIRSCKKPEHFDNCRRWIFDLAAKQVVDVKEAQRLSYIVEYHYRPEDLDCSATMVTNVV